MFACRFPPERRRTRKLTHYRYLGGGLTKGGEPWRQGYSRVADTSRFLRWVRQTSLLPSAFSRLMKNSLDCHPEEP
jgi:hypothetical protein